MKLFILLMCFDLCVYVSFYFPQLPRPINRHSDFSLIVFYSECNWKSCECIYSASQPDQSLCPLLFQNHQLYKNLPEKHCYFLLPGYVAYFLTYLKEIVILQTEKYMSAYWNCIITICVAKLMYQMLVLTWELVIPLCINTFFLFCLSRSFLFLLAFLCQFSNAAL